MTPILRSLLTIALCLLINGADFAGELRHNLFVAKSCYETDQQLTDIVHTFGILGGTAAQDDWQWAGPQFDLDRTVDDFKAEIDAYPNRIKSIELY